MRSVKRLLSANIPLRIYFLRILWCLQLRSHLPAYRLEAARLYKLLVFNYLFSNGDAHLKNFSLLETPQGDFRS